MQDGNLFTRDDTFFGVCQGLGEDLGISPNLFRLAIPVPLFLYPVETMGVYFAAGVVVLLTRLAFPTPRVRTSQAAEAVPVAAEPVPEAAEKAEAEVALAA